VIHSGVVLEGGIQRTPRTRSPALRLYMASASGVCWGTSTSAAAAHSRATAAALARATALWPVTLPCATSA
jgi:hypothetical protein